MDSIIHRYVAPVETAPDQDTPRTHAFLESLDNMVISHTRATALHEARCDAIVAGNKTRLGGLFCLFCGKGPMPSSCSCPTTLSLEDQKRRRANQEVTMNGGGSNDGEWRGSGGGGGDDDLADNKTPRWRMIHVHPCSSHNHCCPRGMCEGRCPDCGGCAMDPAECDHFNPSGSGCIHPDPSNSVSLPLCPRTSEDQTRCYREYQPPVLPEQEEEDETGMLRRPGNERTVLILMGGKEEEGEEEGEEEEEEEEEVLVKKKKKMVKVKSYTTGKKMKAEHSKNKKVVKVKSALKKGKRK